MNSEKQSTNLQMILREVNRVGEGKKNVPKLRFKGYEDAWEQRKVSEITKFHKQGYYTTEEYNDNKKYYLLRGTDLTGNKLVLKDTPKIDASEKDYDAFKTEIGDFLIVRSGNVGTYGIVDIDIPAIFGSYLIDFRFDPEKVTNEFFGYFYQSERFQSQLNKITQSSANININAENIKSTYISLPVLTDQKKISNIMSTLDNCITLHQRKYDALKTMKKTLLSKMFPKDGEDVPEIRFKGFTDAWEQRKFIECINNIVDYRGKTPKKLEMNWSPEGYLALSALNVKDGYIDFELDANYGDIELYNAWMKQDLSKGQVVFTTEAPMGNVAQIPDDSKYILSQRVIAFEVAHEKITDDFLATLLKSPKVFDDLTSLATGGTAKGVSQRSLSKLSVKIPQIIEEQNKIAKIICTLNKAITLHQRKLEELKNMKKTLLQQMFV